MQTKRKHNRKKGIYENTVSKKMEHSRVWETLEKIIMISADSWAADRMERGFLEPLETLNGVCWNTENCQGAGSGQA